MKINVTIMLTLILVSINAFAATEFNLSFSTVQPGGGYRPKNVVTVWVTQTNGTFVKTILRYANAEKSLLTLWSAAAGASDADAVMGPTRGNHNSPAIMTATWDLKNKAGTVVPDGTYRINFEMTDGTKKIHTFDFVKDSTAGTRTNPGTTWFTGISIAYAPPASANTAPVANGQSVTNAEDTSIAIMLTATDSESNTLTYAIATTPSHGTLSGTPPNVTYVPATNYYGTDGFTFTASDASLTSTPATVSITVTPVNDPPVANAQSVTTAEDTAKAITLVATDVETNALTYVIVGNPAHGALSAISSNAVTYTPATNYNGTDSFTFSAYDGTATGNTATVSITVTPVNDAPVAQNQSVTNVLEDTSKLITLVATDVETNVMTYAIVNVPTNGTLSAISSNTVTYKPATNYYGTDSFTFRASDTASTGNTATVSITVTPVNDPPVSQAQSLTATDGNPLFITLSATDAETNALTYKLVSQPATGRLLGTPPSLTYLPVKGLRGSDSFSFNAFDGTVTGNTATVSITLVFIDSASNGIPDSWKIACGLTNAALSDANADLDSDGASNYAEYMAGTDPTNSTSVFAANVPQMTGGSNVVLNWNSVQYRFYTVQATTNLISGWSTLASNRAATPPQNSYTGVVNQIGPVFYRIRLEQ